MLPETGQLDFKTLKTMNRVIPIHPYLTAILLAFFAFVSAAPVSVDTSKTPQELTKDTYHEAGTKGIWWIKFYSPYCHHCKAFAPSWDRTYLKLNSTYEELNFASVNCVAQGDLCEELDIGVYPSVYLYKDGKLMEPLKGVLKEDFMETFIEKQIKQVKLADEIAKENPPPPSRTGTFPTYPGSTDVVNTKYPESIDPEKSDKELDLKDDSIPNPKGKSMELTYLDFTRRVTATRDGWFIQFHSPNSKYSRNIEPAWNQMATEAKGKLNIGHVNCDVEKQLCKEADVKQYPTLKYFASSISSEYKGLRGTGDLILFLNRAVAVSDPTFLSYKDFKTLRKSTDDVTFLYLYDNNTSIEDFQAFEKLGTATIGTVDLAKSNDTQLLEHLKEKNLPALYAVSKEKIVRFPEKTSSGLRNHNLLLDWGKKHRQPLVPQLTPFNYQDIFSNSIVVLAIIDPREEEKTTSAIKELRAAAVELQDKLAKENREELEELRKKKQLKIDEAKDKDDKGAEERANKIKVEVTDREAFSVAWIDAIFWERWIKGRYGAFDGQARVIINNERAGKYWDRTSGGDVLVPSRSSIIETVEAVLSPNSKIPSVSLHNSFKVYISETKDSILSHRNFFFVLIGLILFAIWYKKHYSRPRGHNTTPSEGILGKFD